MMMLAFTERLQVALQTAQLKSGCMMSGAVLQGFGCRKARFLRVGKQAFRHLL